MLNPSNKKEKPYLYDNANRAQVMMGGAYGGSSGYDAADDDPNIEQKYSTESGENSHHADETRYTSQDHTPQMSMDNY